MAKIAEVTMEVKLSWAVADSYEDDATLAAITDDSTLTSIESVVQELVGDKIIVEIVRD